MKWEFCKIHERPVTGVWDRGPNSPEVLESMEKIGGADRGFSGLKMTICKNGVVAMEAGTAVEWVRRELGFAPFARSRGLGGR